ncbi:MAG TPA: hypothetical protein VGP47_11445 [Parachlamydiaceae bacterium]|nr:hypothetical protein [Parachlamydiaceae bacterium]
MNNSITYTAIPSPFSFPIIPIPGPLIANNELLFTIQSIGSNSLKYEMIQNDTSTIQSNSYSEILDIASPVIQLARSYQWFTPCIQSDRASCIKFLAAGITRDKIEVISLTQNLSFVEKSKRLASRVFTDLKALNLVYGMNKCLQKDWRPCARSFTVWLGTNFLID